MKAVIYTKYGPPEVLRQAEITKPVPQDNEVLIKIHATSVTSGDVRMRSFTVPRLFWLMGRISLGFTGPRQTILGCELAGEVEAVGKTVDRFKPGDQVFAATTFGPGTYAEYVCLPEDGPVAIKPANLSHEEAAVVPFGGLSSLLFLRKANVGPGQEVLINGASGAVGSAAVQLAKHFGAVVTGVCSGANVDLVKALGADWVIDYTREDFTRSGQSYDVIYDAVGKTSFWRCKDALKENGTFIAGASVALLGQLQSLTSDKRVIAGSDAEKAEDLAYLREVVESGAFKPVIDRRYPLEDAVEAHRYVDQGHKKGNVVLTVAHNGQA